MLSPQPGIKLEEAIRTTTKTKSTSNTKSNIKNSSKTFKLFKSTNNISNTANNNTTIYSLLSSSSSSINSFFNGTITTTATGFQTGFTLVPKIKSISHFSNNKNSLLSKQNILFNSNRQLKNSTNLSNRASIHQFYACKNSQNSSKNNLMPKVFQLNYDENFVNEKELVNRSSSSESGKGLFKIIIY